MSAMSDLSPGLSVRSRGDDRTLVVEGELDLSTVSGLRNAFEEARPAPGDVILDVSGLSFVDSTGLQAILDLSAELTSGVIVLRNPPPSLSKLLRITGLDRLDGIRVESGRAG